MQTSLTRHPSDSSLLIFCFASIYFRHDIKSSRISNRDRRRFLHQFHSTCRIISEMLHSFFFPTTKTCFKHRKRKNRVMFSSSSVSFQCFSTPNERGRTVAPSEQRVESINNESWKMKAKQSSVLLSAVRGHQTSTFNALHAKLTNRRMDHVVRSSKENSPNIRSIYARDDSTLVGTISH